MRRMFADGGSGRWHKRVLRRHLAIWRFSVSVLLLPWHVMFPGYTGNLSLGISWEGLVGRPPEHPRFGRLLTLARPLQHPPETLTTEILRTVHTNILYPPCLSYLTGFSSGINYSGVATGIKYLASFFQILGAMCDTFGYKIFGSFFLRKPRETQNGHW